MRGSADHLDGGQGWVFDDVLEANEQLTVIDRDEDGLDQGGVETNTAFEGCVSSDAGGI